MGHEWLRRTKATSPRCKLGHFILPETAAMPVIIAQHLFERENSFFRYQHPVRAGLQRWICFAVAPVTGVHRLPDDAKVNVIWRGAVALLRPIPQSFFTDGFNNLRGLMHVVKTVSVLVYVGRRVHPHIGAWLATQFKSDLLV